MGSCFLDSNVGMVNNYGANKSISQISQDKPEQKIIYVNEEQGQLVL